MIAVVVTSQGTVAARDHKEPLGAPGVAVVRPILVPITHDDLRAPVGVVPCGRCVGIVEAAPPDAPTWKGKRVLVTPVTPCRSCRLCRGGLAAHCRSARALGSDSDGCLAERVAVATEQLIETPDHLSDEDALIAFALAAACHSQQAVHIGSKPFVTVLGDTTEALLCAQVLAARNATVRLLGRDPDRYTICERWGIKHRDAREVGRHADQHAVFDWTGSSEWLSLAAELTMPKGAIVLCARTAAQGIDADCVKRITRSEITLVGSFGGSEREACDMLASGRVSTIGLPMRRFRLSAASEAFTAAKSGAELMVAVDLR